MKFNKKNTLIIFLIMLMIFIVFYNFLLYNHSSYKEGLKIKNIKKAVKNVGKKIGKGIDKAAEETRKAAEKAAEETRKAAEKAAEETRKVAEKAAEELNFLKAFQKLFGAFGALENLFSKFPKQMSSLFQDALDFKNNTIKGIQNI
jgi:histone H3/H4